MENPGSSKQRFTDKQVADILRRAAELQHVEGSDVSSSGSSENEILAIGSELGLRQESIRQAIDEIGSGVAPGSSVVLGAPLSMEMERVYNTTADDDAWQELVAEFRRSFGRIGEMREVGSVREWEGKEGGLDPIHWSLHQKDGVGKLRATSDLGGATFLLVFLSCMVTLIGTVVTFQLSHLELAARFGIAALLLAVVGFTVRQSLSGMARRRQRAIQSVMNKADAILAPEGEISTQEPESEKAPIETEIRTSS